MKRTLFVLAFAAGLVASLMAVKQVLPTETVKTEVARAIAGLIGGPVEVAADAEIDLMSGLTVRLSHVSLNRPGLAAARPATVGAIVATLDVLPLLSGRVALAEVALESPDFDIIAPQGPNGLGIGKAELARLEPIRITIADGRLRLIDADNRPTETIDAINGTFSWARLTSGASLSGSLRWRGETVALSVQGIGPRALAEGTAGAIAVTINSAPLKLSFDGKGLLVDTLQLDGMLSVAAPDLRRLAGWLGTAISPGVELADFALRGRMRSLGAAATLSNAALSLDGNGAEGVVSARFDLPRPQLRGTLAADRLDLSRYAELIAGADWRASPLSAALLSAFDLDLRLSARDVSAGALTLKRMAAAALIKDGRFVAEIGDVQVLGGNGSMSLRGEALDGGITMSGRGALTDVSAATAALAFGLGNIKDGRLNLTGEIDGHGADLGGFVDGLTGKLSADLRALTLKGGNTFGAGERPIPAALNSATVRRPPTFDRADARIDIAWPKALVRDLAAEGPSLSFKLTGEASLVTGALALSGEATLLDRGVEAIGTAAKTVVPVTVGGTIAKPIPALSAEIPAPPLALDGQDPARP